VSGWRYKWVSTSLKGEVDTTAIKKAEKRGWSPVPPDEMPDLDEHAKLLQPTMRLYRMLESNAVALGTAHAPPVNIYLVRSAKADPEHTRWQAAERLREEGILPPIETDDEREEARILLEDFFGSYSLRWPKMSESARKLREHLGLPKMLDDGTLEYLDPEQVTGKWRRVQFAP
jgi:hypothetical protein